MEFSSTLQGADHDQHLLEGAGQIETQRLRLLQTTTTTKHPMTTVPRFMGFIYSGMLGMIAIYAILFFNFLGKEEKDPNLLGEGSGCCAKMYSLIIRVFPLLMKLGHYGVLILIIVQISTVFFGSKCESPFYYDDFGIKKTSPVVQLAEWGTAISAWFWVTRVFDIDYDPYHLPRMEEDATPGLLPV